VADNTTLQAGAGGDTLATDEISDGGVADGAKVQRIKAGFGADNNFADPSGGAGAVDAGTGRTTLASDDPAVLALQVMDDWDETDRCAVNPISGQAGVAGGTGVDGATVQRMSLATNVPLPVGSNRVGKVTIRDSADAADIDPLAESTFTGRINTQGQKTMAASTPVVLPSDQSAIPVTATLSGTGDVNLVQVAGTATSVGSGALDAGTQRVVLPTDQPAVPISAASLPLPSGAATAANQATIIGHVDGVEALLGTIDADTSALAAGQLPDGHNVTVDNAAGAAAVNVQDGGNSLTVDGAVTVSGTVAVSSITTAVVPGTGATNLGKAEDAVHVSGDTGVFALGVRNDGVTQTSRTSATGDYSPLSTDVSGNVLVAGNLPHDAVDAGSPVKVGGRARDYHPDASNVVAGGLAEVTAENDRANAAMNLRGEAIEGVNSFFFTLDNVSTTYNNTTTTATSTAKECWNYRWATIGFTLSSSSTPTDITFAVEVSLDGTNYVKMMGGPLGLWIYDDTACTSAISPSLTFPIACQLVRLKVTATGTDATNTFTVANATLYLRN